MLVHLVNLFDEEYLAYTFVMLNWLGKSLCDLYDWYELDELYALCEICALCKTIKVACVIILSKMN